MAPSPVLQARQGGTGHVLRGERSGRRSPRVCSCHAGWSSESLASSVVYTTIAQRLYWRYPQLTEY